MIYATFTRAPIDNGFAPNAYNAQGDADRLSNLRETSSFGPLQYMRGVSEGGQSKICDI